MATISTDLIEQHWPLHDTTLKAPLHTGPRPVWHIGSAEGEYILKSADHSKDTAAVERDTAIFSFLQKHDFLAPKLLPTKTGQPYIEYDGRYWYMLSYVAGDKPARTPDNFRQLGELTARLHSLNGYNTATSFTFAQEMEYMRRRATLKHAPENYLQLVNQLPDLSAMPTALIHTDIGPNNAVQDKTGRIYFIDWDDAGIGTRLFDLGCPLFCGFLSDDLQFEGNNAQAFYGGYINNGSLTIDEKSHIFDAGLFYVLMYTMDDEHFYEVNLRKALWAIEHRREVESIVGDNIAGGIYE